MTRPPDKPPPLIAYLDRPVRLLEDAGPMVYGITVDAILGDALYRAWQG